MAEQWYFAENGQQQGPVTPAQLGHLAATGRVGPATLVWRPGLPQWVPAAGLKGLFPAQAAIPPQPPPIRYAPPPATPSAGPYPRAAYPAQRPANQPTAAAPGVMVKPGFWRRFLCILLDVAALLVPSVVLLALVFAAFSAAGVDTAHNPSDVFRMAGTVYLGVALIDLAYFSIFHAAWGKTVGKMAGGLRVVNLDGSGISFGTATARAFLFTCGTFVLALALLATGSMYSVIYYAAMAVVCLWGWADCLAIFFPDSAPMQRALHDRICGTRVIVESPR